MSQERWNPIRAWTSMGCVLTEKGLVRSRTYLAGQAKVNASPGDWFACSPECKAEKKPHRDELCGCDRCRRWTLSQHL